VRILIATTHRGIVGGTETYLRTLLPALRDRGHDLALLYDVPAPDGRETFDAGCPGLPAWAYDVPGSLEAAARWRPEVCYLHGMLRPDSEEQLTARFPTVLFAHNYFGTCATGTKCHGWPGAGPCSRQFGPACLALNYLRRCGARRPLVLWRHYSYQRRRNRLLRRFKAVLVASRHMAGEFLRHGVAPERVVVAPLPVAVSPLPEEPARRPMTGRVVMAGRFTNLKGGDVLLAAARQASEKLGRDLCICFVGEGPAKARWEAEAARLGTAAEFLGWCGPGRLAELYAGADLVAVPSVWPEPFGLVGIEAGCVGLPAVGFAVGGTPDWLVPGMSGEAAPSPPTAAGLAGAIVRALADADHHHRLRVGAWEVARTFTFSRHFQVLEAALLARGETGAPGASTPPALVSV
jgi:glycosyltransferase involved in cell wall biosynthesis